MKSDKVRGRRGSVILRALNRFSERLGAFLSRGFFGWLFGLYTKADELLSKSFLASLFGRESRIAYTVKRVRFAVAENFENSRLLYLWQRLIRFLIGCRMRFYGSFVMVSGIYTGLIYMIKRFAFSTDLSDSSYIVYSLAMVLAALPMLMSGKTLAQALGESRLGHLLVSDILGIPDEKLQLPMSKHGDSYNIAIIGGLLFGTLTYLVSPGIILAGILFAVVAAIVMASPESGVMTAVLTLPFMQLSGFPRETVCGLVFLFTFSYLMKLLRGRRLIKIELYDIIIALFGVLLLFGGSITAGSTENDAPVLFLMLSGGFVAVNVLRTRGWLERCRMAFVLSALAVSLAVIWRTAINFADTSWIGVDINLFGADAFFDNTKTLVTFLLLALPFAYSLAFGGQGRRVTAFGVISSLTVLTALAFAGSVAGWVSAFAVTLLYCLIVYRKTLTVLILACLGIPYYMMLFPDSIASRLTESLTFSSQTGYRMLSVWGGTLRMAAATMFGGIGVGAFSTVYPRYADLGNETAADTCALWLRIICDTGLVGLIIFVIVIFLFAQNCIGYISHKADRFTGRYAAAGFVAVCGVLVQSLTSDIWSDLRSFFLFWVVGAMTVACIRYGRTERERQEQKTADNEYSASVDIIVGAVVNNKSE